MKLKLHIKNQLKGKIEFCCGKNEYELEPEQEVTVQVADEDCMYFDTIVFNDNSKVIPKRNLHSKICKKCQTEAKNETEVLRHINFAIEHLITVDAFTTMPHDGKLNKIMTLLEEYRYENYRVYLDWDAVEVSG